jgi:hypothetical protein
MANRKISDLTALTAPATGDLLPIVDISEAAAADKNKKITIGELFASIPLGSAAAPSVAFEGDSNTGIYSSGADQVAISTNGTGRLFVDASGSVGLGTSSPATTFHLGGSSDQSVQINGSGTAAFVGTSTSVAQISSNRNPTTGAIYDANRAVSYVNLEASNGNANIQFYTTVTNNANALERARIDSSGRLLVGTSSDSGGALLQVNGDRIRIGTAKTPASATATGTTGEIAWDANYIYVCTATNTWKRTAIATW